MIPTSVTIARDTVTATAINTTKIKARGQISDALQLGQVKYLPHFKNLVKSNVLKVSGHFDCLLFCPF